MIKRTKIVAPMVINTTCSAAFLECETRGTQENMYCDPYGLYWCEEHKHRGRLLSWAKNHGYPAISFAGTERSYAIGDSLEDSETNEMLWKMATRVGNEDMVWSAFVEAMGIDDEGEEAI